MSVETATVTNPTDSPASSEASTTLLATASSATDTTQQTQTTETQTPPATETPAAETKTEAGKETPVAVVPEKYDFKAPEGKEYDPQVLESFAGAAKEAGLTQDAAQKLIDKMAPALAARQNDQVQALHKAWTEASTADAEFGGEKLQENLGVAKRALDAFDPQPRGADGKPVLTPLRKLLEDTGLGNHPEVLRFFYRAGKAISEDKFVAGSGRGTGAKPSAAAILYDKQAAAK